MEKEEKKKGIFGVTCYYSAWRSSSQ
jgi:hypothetical protein